MDARVAQVSELLHQAAETHHTVYRIVDGADDDWALWYADWLSRLSELSKVLGFTPTTSELVYLLVGLDKEYTAHDTAASWEDTYAEKLVSYFDSTRRQAASQAP